MLCPLTWESGVLVWLHLNFFDRQPTGWVGLSVQSWACSLTALAPISVCGRVLRVTAHMVWDMECKCGLPAVYFDNAPACWLWLTHVTLPCDTLDSQH
jgi:hypothetical protein